MIDEFQSAYDRNTRNLTCMAVAWTIALQDKALLADVFQWDVSNWARALHVWEPVLKTIPSGRALALGEREGGLSLYLALHGHRVICSDLASPEASARPLHERYQIQQRITYEAQDITNIQHPDEYVRYRGVQERHRCLVHKRAPVEGHEQRSAGC